MKNNQKRALYESIMRSVAKTVKRALNEQDEYEIDIEAIKAASELAGPPFWDDIQDNIDDYADDYMTFFNKMLEYGINLKTFKYYEVNLSDEYYGEIALNPRKLNGLDSDIKRYIINWVAAGQSDFDEWDNYAEEHNICDELNCIGVVNFTDHVSYIDNWYVIQMSNGKKCILFDGRERDSFGYFVEI